MDSIGNKDYLRPLLDEVEILKKRYDLSFTVTDDYFEPGMMEYLEQSYGEYNETDNRIILRFEVKGTRYEGRSERIESIHEGDSLRVIRDKENPFNANNFYLSGEKEDNLGTMPASICNALAPLYDEDLAIIEKAFVSFVEPLSKRSRYARQAMLFAEVWIRIKAN